MSTALGSCEHLIPVDMSDCWPDPRTERFDPALPDEPQIAGPPKVIGGVIQ